MTGFLVLNLMFLVNKLKRDVKNSAILFVLFASSISLMVVKQNYKPDLLDYFLLIWLVIYLIFKIINKGKKNKLEEIFEEERKWKEETFRK